MVCPVCQCKENCSTSPLTCFHCAQCEYAQCQDWGNPYEIEVQSYNEDVESSVEKELPWDRMAQESNA